MMSIGLKHIKRQPNISTLFVATIASSLIFILLTSPAYSASGETTLNEIERLKLQISHVWMALAIMVVFFMKGGFLLFEAGLVRSKNTINTAQKNLTDTILATLIFYFFGYNMMFGDSIGGFWGWNSHNIDFHEVDHTFFLYQVVFCSMAATVVSGALAERIKFTTYMVNTMFVTAFVYPIFGHWAWGDKILVENSTWLIEDGFIDFAGATVVCAVGGWVSLAGLIVIGPRTGKYNADGSINPMPASNVVLAGFGMMILWVGALAFNSGLAEAGSENVAHVMSNTLLAGAAGGMASLFIGRYMDGLFRPERCIYGVLGGLVAIAAGCHLFNFYETLIVGLCSGMLVAFSFAIMTHKLRLDDVVAAVPINAFCGAFGTLCIGPMGDINYFGNNTPFEQFLAQAEGVIASFIWAFSTSYIFFYILNKTTGIRVSPEEEEEGLNSAEHGVTMGTGLLQERLKDIVDGEGDLTKRLDETTGDESAELAILFNRFSEQMQTLMIQINQNSKILGDSSDRLKNVSQEFSHSFDNISKESADISKTNAVLGQKVDEASQSTEEINSNIQLITSNAQDMSNNLNEVSITLKDISASIDHMAQESTQVLKTTNEANSSAKIAFTEIEQLKTSADDINSIIDLVKKIAHQTNLLALNATIEASRAGEAGKGFGIVANEVKELAKQTTDATEKITQKVYEIQKDTIDAKERIDGVVGLIGTIDSAMNDMADKINQQSTGTQKISDRVERTSESASNVASSIKGISSSAQKVSTSMKEAYSKIIASVKTINSFSNDAQNNKDNAHRISETSQDLSSISDLLNNNIKKYKVSDDTIEG